MYDRKRELSNMGVLLNLSFLLVDFTSKGVFSAFFNG